MKSNYSRDQLLEHSCVASDLLALWEEAGVIASNERSENNVHHVVQAVVCDRLYRFGLNVATLGAACRAIDHSWQSGVATAFSAGHTVLWVSFSHNQIRKHGTRREAAGSGLQRSAPRTIVVSALEIVSDIEKDERFGMVVNLVPIVREIEERTGEKLTP